MGEFRVHHIRFFEYQPKSINCLTYCANTHRLAVSRSDGSIEIWNTQDYWYQERVIPGFEGKSVEAICWQDRGNRLFTAGLDGYVTEYDLLRLKPKNSASSNAGPIWCMTSDSSHKYLAAGTEDGCVVLFDIQHNFLEYKQAFGKQEGRILCIAWHVAGDIIVTGGIDNIRLWSVNSGHAVQRMTLGRQDKNKETIVWCVAVTSDMTIISGDSRGKTTFWNGRQGTLIKTHQCHRADVFCLCVNQDETSVYSSGVDPSIAQFNFTATQRESDWKVWVRGLIQCKHTHDVRGLTIVDDFLVSGGMDTNLIASKCMIKKGQKYWRKIPGIPHKSMVCVSKDAKLVTLKYADYLEVWRLGHTNCRSDKNGDLLPVQSNPLKLLQLKNKSSEPIVCFAVSCQGNRIAFSDQRSVKAYTLSVTDKELMNPKVSLQRLKFKATEKNTAALPAHQMALSVDGQCLVTATECASVQVLTLEDGQMTVDHTFPPVLGDENAVTLTHLALSSEKRLAAVSDCANNITLYNLTERMVLCKLPRYSCQATALAFTPSGTELVIFYADQTVYEFDVMNKEYSAWCKETCSRFPAQWMKRTSKVSHIDFQANNPDKIFLQDEQMFCILDKSQPFPKNDVKLYSRSTFQESSVQEEQHAFHMCGKYKYLLHLETLNDDWLVVVERPPLTIMEALPETLKMKKFGT